MFLPLIAAPTSQALSHEDFESESKKAKTEKKNPVNMILEFLSFEEILAFEGTCKPCIQLTAARWRSLSEFHRVEYDWSYCHESEFPDRTRCVLGKALQTYLLQRARLAAGRTTEKKILSSFQGMMMRYPLVDTLIRSDLQNLRTFSSPDEGLLPEKLPSLKNPMLGGDLLIHAILHANQVIHQSGQKRMTLLATTFELFSRAIHANANCASLFAIQILFHEHDDENYFFNLAAQSNERGDSRGMTYLQSLVFSFSSDSICRPSRQFYFEYCTENFRYISRRLS